MESILSRLLMINIFEFFIMSRFIFGLLYFFRNRRRRATPAATIAIAGSGGWQTAPYLREPRLTTAPPCRYARYHRTPCHAQTPGGNGHSAEIWQRPAAAIIPRRAAPGRPPPPFPTSIRQWRALRRPLWFVHSCCAWKLSESL